MAFTFPPYSGAGSSGPFEFVVYDLWYEIPASLETVIYDTKTPVGVLAHDHADRRGGLIETPIFCSMTGPQAANGGAVGSWTEGTPMFPPSAGVSFVTTPKLIWVSPVEIPANASGLHVELIFFMNGLLASRAVTLKACLRPMTEHGAVPGKGIRIEQTLVHTDTTVTPTESRNAFLFTDLTALGDLGLTKSETILEIWLTTNPTAGETYKLLHVMPIWYTEHGHPSYGEPLDWSGQRISVDPAAFRAGQLVEAPVAQAGHLKHNQVTVEALGNAPGLSPNLETVNEADVYQRYIRRRHKHQGRSFTDPYQNEEKSDGSVLRSVLWSQSYLWNFGDTAADMGTDPPVGLALHPGGTLGTGWAQIESRLEVPIGLKAFDVRFGVQPGTSNQLARCYLFADVRDPVAGASLPFYIGLNGGVSDATKSGAYTKVIVDPRDGKMWQRNTDRLAQGLGLWTKNAAKLPQPPNTLSTGVANLTRFSKDVRLYLTNPLTRTGGVLLRIAFAIETGALGSATYDTTAALTFVDVFSPAGY